MLYLVVERTEGLKSYHKCNENQKIFSFDVVSLYPSVNAMDCYAVGCSKYVNITADDTLVANFTLIPVADTFTLTILVNPTGTGNAAVNGTTPASYPTTFQFPTGTLVNGNALLSLDTYSVNGNYGINTRNPVSPLHVQGNAGILSVEGEEQVSYKSELHIKVTPIG